MTILHGLDHYDSQNGHWLTQSDLPNSWTCVLKGDFLWVCGPFAFNNCTNSCKFVLKLVFLWVCGPFAFNNCANIVRKPTILWVCGPRTRSKVALRMALGQNDRAPNSENRGFETQFAQISVCVDMASSPQFIEIGARFDYL